MFLIDMFKLFALSFMVSNARSCRTAFYSRRYSVNTANIMADELSCF